MILHIATFDKFIPPFVGFVNENFSPKNHLFYLTGDDKTNKLNQADNVILIRKNNVTSILYYIRLIPMLFRAKKVIVHGLFDIKLVLLLTLMPFVLYKCYWVIWGGDLYQYQIPRKTLKSKIWESLRAFVIKRFGYLVTYIPGDVELARTWYGAKGKYRECLMYLSNVVDFKLVDNIAGNHKTTNSINILVGNSADPSNNHFEVLDKLLEFKNEDIQIFVPLSYGNKNHAKSVIDYGKSLFGKKFRALTEFMPIEQYHQFLGSIDLAVFNHKRQQAMGNTISLLGMGKTVYLRTDVSQWSFFVANGLFVRDINELNDTGLLSTSERRINREQIGSYFTVEVLKEQYKVIFE